MRYELEQALWLIYSPGSHLSRTFMLGPLENQATGETMARFTSDERTRMTLANTVDAISAFVIMAELKQKGDATCSR